MEAISKRTGKVFTGKLASVMLRIGAAAPNDGSYVKPVKKPKAKKKVKK